MRVILADPPRKEGRYHLSYPNLGILYLISYLRKNIEENNLEICYLEGHCSLKEHIAKVKSFNPNIYGISFATETSPIAYKAIKAVKKTLLSAKIVCGGAHPSVLPEEALKFTPADICVVGEGEQTFFEIVKKQMEGKDVRGVNGLAYRNGAKIAHTSKRKFFIKLDSHIPFPAWDIIDFRKYPGMHFRKTVPQTCVSVARGCPFDCVFCSNPVWSANKPRVRVRDPKKIKEEVRILHKKGIKEIYLSADEFNVNLEWATEVCSHIIKLRYDDLYFQCNLRADKITEKFVQKLNEMKVWMVHVGVESGDQRVLDGIEKKITLEQVIDALKLFKKYKIKVLATMMLYQVWVQDGKVLYETTQEVHKSLNFMKDLFKRNLIHYLSWQFATPFPGSKLYDIANKYNLLLEKAKYRSVREPSLQIPGISEREMIKAMRRGIFLKNIYALKSGNIEWRHWQRMLENIRAIARF